MPVLPMRFEPGDVEEARATIEELADRYEAWFPSRNHGADGVDASDLALLLEWKVGWGDGRLDEWSVYDVEEFLLEWCPRKLSAPAESAVAMAHSVAEAFFFLSDQGLLARHGDSVDTLAERTRSIAPEFQKRMADPANFGTAKSLLAGMGVDFDQDLSEVDLEGLMEQFNALPEEQRKAILDPHTGGPQPGDLTVGPVLLPGEEEVRAAAVAAPVLAGFRALNDYFAPPGRPLTAKGNIRLADADALSGIIGSESVAYAIGDRTYRRQSTAEMPTLDHWQWWARQAGAIRVSKGRMVGVKAWRQRYDKDPVGEAAKAFRVLLDFGVVASRQTHYRWPGDEVIDSAVGALLMMVLQSPEPTGFDDLVEAVLRVRARLGVRPPIWDAEVSRSRVVVDVDTMLDLLERAGVVTQRDVAYETTWLGERRSGGTVELTDFGVVVVVEAARDQGVRVETIESSAHLEVEDLVDVVERRPPDMGRWWSLVRSWMAQQEEPRRALAELLDEIDDTTQFHVLTQDPPDDLLDDLAAVLLEALDTHGPEDVLAAIGLGWLDERGRLDPETLDPRVASRARYTLLGVFAADDPEVAVEAMGEGHSREQLLADVAEISRLMTPNAVALLDAIGRHHPDKVVAKSARREALRVRSRLANKRKG